MGEGRVYIVAIAIADNDVIVLLFNQFIFVMTHKHLSDEILGKVSSFGWVHTPLHPVRAFQLPYLVSEESNYPIRLSAHVPHYCLPDYFSKVYNSAVTGVVNLAIEVTGISHAYFGEVGISSKDVKEFDAALAGLSEVLERLFETEKARRFVFEETPILSPTHKESKTKARRHSIKVSTTTTGPRSRPRRQAFDGAVGE